MIDFRSDTVTKPTEEMRLAMYKALVGDDVYEDDETIKQLEEKAAFMLGKKAALFVPSGTMGNQIAIMCHTRRGDEIIVGANSHIKNYEVGAAAVLSAVSFHLVKEVRGMMPFSDIEKGIRQEDIHFPITSLICIENAHGTGVVGDLDYMKQVYDLATHHRVNVHLDGARLFNAAVHLNCHVKDLAQYADSIMFCLSKGLASPIGSMLVGSKDFIKKARKYRKLLGGGMRQVGVLGAPGLIALETMSKRIHEDHEHARYLAEKLSVLPEFSVDFEKLDINMVYVKTSLDRTHWHDYMKQNGFILGGYKGDTMRLVCHHDITKESIDLFIQCIENYLKSLEKDLSSK